MAYASKALSAYAQPHVSGEIAASYPAFTPLEVLEEHGFFAVLPQGDGSGLYIPLSALMLLKEDTNVAAYHAYLRNADVLYRFPLAGSPVEMVLRMGEEMVVSATNGDYAYVNSGCVAAMCCSHSTLNELAGLAVPVPDIMLPLGISFFTFQACRM